MNCSQAEHEITERASLYVLGALSQTEARAFESHLDSGCEACAAELRTLQAVTLLLAGESAVEPPPSARERLLQEITPPAGPALSQFVEFRVSEGDWREISPGILRKELFVDKENGTVTSLFRFAPGVSVPRHQHTGAEQCLVVEGDFHVNGKAFGPGDFSCAMPGSVHESVHTESGALVLIVAANEYRMG